MTAHCPSHGEVLAPASISHCPLCGLPLLVNADGGHGLRWLDDRNRTERFAQAVAAVDAKYPAAMSRLARPTPE